MSPSLPTTMSLSAGQDIKAGTRGAKRGGWPTQGLVLPPLGSPVLHSYKDQGWGRWGHSPYHPEWVHTVNS